MFLARNQTDLEAPLGRRRYDRHDVHCRARILIGNRHYAGYLENISQGGARLRTITPIRKLGKVLLRVPDMPPLRGQLRWTERNEAGIAFELILQRAALERWATSRSRSASLEDSRRDQLEAVA